MSSFWERFLPALEQNNIPYCVLGFNYPSLEHFCTDNDVDIVIPSHDFHKWLSLILEIATNVNATVLQSIQHEVCAYYLVLSHENNGLTDFIKLDICSDYLIHSRPYLRASTLLTGREKIHLSKDIFFYVPMVRSNIMYSFVKGYYKNKVGSSFRNSLVSAISNAPVSEQLYLSTLLLSPSIDHLLGILSTSTDLDFAHFLHFAKDKVCTASAFSTFEKLQLKFQNLYRVFSRIKNPTGVSIAFVGPDGAGKSTLISNSFQQLSVLFRYHLYSHMLPRSLCKVTSVNCANSVVPSQLPPYNLFLSFLKLGYVFFYCWLTWIINILPRLRKSHCLYLDRYMYDLILDPKRLRISLPYPILKLSLRMLPRPDLVFILSCEPSVIHQRKNELSLCDIKQYISSSKLYFQDQPSAHFLDCALPPKILVQNLQTVILDYMRRRLLTKFVKS